MPHPISQVQIEQQMLAILDDQEKLLDTLASVGRDAVDKEADYKRTYARAYLSADQMIGKGDNKLPVKTREIYADHICEQVFHAFKLADFLAKQTREALRVKERRLDILRSLNSNLRPMVSSGG